MNGDESKIPTKYLQLYLQGRAGKTKIGTRYFCLECVGFDPNEVQLCTNKTCVNYPMRNLKAQAETESADRAKRRARSLAAGLRPPQLGHADRHHDRVGGPILNDLDAGGATVAE
jgi:hypothetical protein